MMVTTERNVGPHACHRPGRAVTWVVVAAFAPAVILVLFCAHFALTFQFGMRPVEYIDLSYAEYAAKVGIEGFDPTEGRRISFKMCPSIDSSDYWWKLTVPAPQYESLRQAEDRAPIIGEVVGPVRKTTGDDARMPRDWPAPDTPPPSWWKPPTGGPGVECTRWQTQLSGRGVGRYWVYDRRTATLWIWRWNDQWFEFGRQKVAGFGVAGDQ